MKRENGRFSPERGAYIDDKGYIRIGCGPQRGMRLHRLVAAAKLGRPLKKDEDVHHLDGNKLNNSPDNIHIMGHREHSCVSAKQHWYLEQKDIHLKNEWDVFFEDEA